MAVLQVTTDVTGLAGILPQLIYINTNDTLATVTTAGYLAKEHSEGYQFTNNQMAVVNTTTGTVMLAVNVSLTTGVITLVSPQAAAPIFIGDVTTRGGFISLSPTVADGSLELIAANNAGNFANVITNASFGQATTLTIPDPGVAATNFLLTDNAGTQTIATGSLALTVGTLTLGSSNHASSLTIFPPTAANGFFQILPIAAGGAFNTIVSNSAMGQTSTISIPDPGAATANFLLDQGAGNRVTDYQQMIPLSQFLLAAGGGVFAVSRTAQGDWSQLKVAGADTSVIALDITAQLRAAANKGYELTSFDIIYSIGTLDLNANTATLATTVYANNVAVAVTNVAITGGALQTATQANPYVSNVTVNAPAFTNPAAGTSVKQVIELSVNAAATSIYAFLGANLRFTKTIS